MKKLVAALFAICVAGIALTLHGNQSSLALENIKGELTVVEGRPVYSLPIAVPAGINNLKPEINLTYSPNGGATNMGSGFSVSASSSIDRCTATPRKDGYFAGLEQSANTRFCHDGMKLVAQSGTSGAAGSTYRAYSDNNHIYTAVGGSNYTPESWQEKSPDGTVMIYRKANGFNGITAQWLLSEKRDAYGNTIHYNYGDASIPQLTSIVYTGVEVNFSYENRNAALNGYRAGQPYQYDARLAAIHIVYDNHPAWNYQFTYEAVNGPVALERLASVVKCYGENEACTQPLVFEYEAGSPRSDVLDLPENRTLVIPRSAYVTANDDEKAPYKRPTYQQVDLNNDGMPDFCFYKPGQGLLCALYEKPGQYSEPALWTGDLGFAANQDDYRYYARPMFVDLDGNGYQDLCFMKKPTGVQCSYRYDADDKFTSFQVVESNFTFDSNIFFNDADGDLYLDICGNNYSSNNKGEQFANLQCISLRKAGLPLLEGNKYLISGGGIYELYSYFADYETVVKYESYVPPFLFDYDGDLEADLCRMDGSGYFKCSKSAFVDGILKANDLKSFAIDIAGFPRMPVPGVYDNFRSNGSTIQKTYEADRIRKELDDALKYIPVFKASLRFVDINSDALQDFCLLEVKSQESGYDNPNKKYVCYINHGGNFTKEIIFDTSDHVSDLTDSAFISSLNFVDYNFDGYPDLCFISQHQLQCLNNTGGSFAAAKGLLNIVPDYDYSAVSKNYFTSFSQSLAHYKTSYKLFMAGASYGNPIYTNDVNGNGYMEFCYRHYGATTDLVAPGITCTDMDNSVPQGKLKSIQDSYGFKTSIEYAAYQSGGLLDKSITINPPQGYVEQLHNNSLVAKISQQTAVFAGGQPQETSIEYRYGPYLQGLTGRGGNYAYVVLENPERHGKTVSTLYLDEILGGQEKTIKQYINGVLMSETTNNLSSGYNEDTRTYQPITISVLRKQYDEQGTLLSQVTNANSSFDSFNFPERNTVTTVSGGQTTTSVTTTVYSHDTVNWLLGRPSNTTVTHTGADGSVVSRTVGYHYDGKNLQSQIIGVGSNQPKTLEYTYYENGELKTTRTSDGTQTRYATSEYDALGRVISDENSLGQITRYQYSPYCGVSQTTGPTGNSVYTEYDASCQKMREYNSLDANVTEWEYLWQNGAVLWENNGDSPNVRPMYYTPAYYSVTQKSATGAEVTTYHGADGGVIRSRTKTTADANHVRYSLQDTVRDPWGRTIASSVPYFETDSYAAAAGWIYSTYDDFDRIIVQDVPAVDGQRSITTYEYNGRIMRSFSNGYEKITETGINGKVSRVEENGRWVEYQYDAYGNLVSTNNQGQISTITYDVHGNKRTQSSPETGTWRYDYNVFGELVSQTDAKNQTTTMQYDVAGRLFQRTDATGITQWLFNNDGPAINQIKAEIAPSARRDYVYNDKGQLQEVQLTIDSQTFVTRYDYDEFSRPKTVTQHDGMALNNYYDAVGNLKTVTMPQAQMQDYEYSEIKKQNDALVDNIIQLELEIRAVELRAQYYFERYADHIEALTYNKTQLEFIGADQEELQALIDKEGDIAKSFGLAASDYRAAADKAYTDVGNLSLDYKGIENGKYKLYLKKCLKKAAHSLGENLLGKSCTNWGEYQYYFDTGNLSNEQNPVYFFDGSPMQTHWALENKKFVKVSDSYKPYQVFQNVANRFQLLAQDSAGRKQALQDKKANAGYKIPVQVPYIEDTWVLIGTDIPVPLKVAVTRYRTEWQARPAAEATSYYQAQVNTYATLAEKTKQDYFNSLNNIDQLMLDMLTAKNTLADSLANPLSTGYTNDKLNNIVGLEDLWHGDYGQVTLWSVLDRDPSGGVASELFGNGNISKRNRDEVSGRITTAETYDYRGNQLLQTEYDYDLRGRIINRDMQLQDGKQINEAFDYNNDNRITRWGFSQTDSAVNQHLEQEYRYDQYGNLSYKTNAGILTVDATNNRLLNRTFAGQQYNYNYDTNGNMLNGDSRTYTWNAFNKIASVSRGSKSVSYRYDAGQNRVKQQTANKTTYYVNPGFEVVLDNSSGSTVTRYIHHVIAGNDVVATYEKSSAGDKASYYHRDLNGNGQLITSASGSVQQLRLFSPYGEDVAELLGGSAAQYDRLRGYTSHEMVDDVQLINMNARHYDTFTARFVSADTIVPDLYTEADFNRYAYVRGNPVSLRDPSGHCPWCYVAAAVFFDSQLSNNPDYRLIGMAAAAAAGGEIFGGLAAGYGIEGFMGAAISGSATSLAISALSTGRITNQDVVNAGVAGFSAGVTWGIGDGGWVQGEYYQATAHAVFQGTMSHLQGGSFIQGAIGGLVGKLVGKELRENNTGEWHVLQNTMIVAGSAYLSAKVTGGRPGAAMASAVMVYLFNEEGAAAQRVWPVPGHRKLNSADKPGEGDGAFGSCRRGGCAQPHRGIDIEAPVGADVVAFTDGTVVPISPNPSSTYGNQVVIDHGNGVFSQSAHLDSLSVSPGDTVIAGQLIGTVGRTGNTPVTGDSHLHFEIRIGSKLPVAAGGSTDDPMKYLP